MREGHEAVGRLAHRRDDDDELPAGRARRDAPGDVPDLLVVGDRRAAVLLDDPRHSVRNLPRARPQQATHGATRARGPRLEWMVAGGAQPGRTWCQATHRGAPSARPRLEWMVTRGTAPGR